jgi:alpha-beta hydrolase superfamily lysophospholipase
VTSTMRAGLGYVEGVGRIRLHYRSWEVDEPDAAILLVHGLFEHGGRYQEVGEFMAGAGFSTFALDMRGHGASEGRRGHVSRFEILLQDLDRFRREVQGLVPPATPLFLLGHALGGLVSLRYLEEYDAPVAGAVITSPCFGTAVPVPRWKDLLATVLDRALPAFPLRVRFDTAALTSDSERANEYRDDPAIHSTLTPRMFTATSSAIHMALQRGDRIDVPVHILFAADDRVIDSERSRAFSRSLPSDMVTVRVLDGVRHEMLHDRRRGAVMAEIRDWIAAHVG